MEYQIDTDGHNITIVGPYELFVDNAKVYYVVLPSGYIPFRVLGNNRYTLVRREDNFALPLGPGEEEKNDLVVTQMAAMPGAITLNFKSGLEPDLTNATEIQIDDEQPEAAKPKIESQILETASPEQSLASQSVPELAVQELEPSAEPATEPLATEAEPETPVILAPPEQMATEAEPEAVQAEEPEPEPEPAGDLKPVTEGSLSDFFDGLVSFEITDVKFIQGLSEQVIGYNLDRIRSLADTDDADDFLKQKNGNLVVDLLLLSRTDAKYKTLAERLVYLRGLPNWIVPGVALVKHPAKIDRLNAEPLGLQAAESKYAEWKLDPPMPVVYLADFMPTDRPGADELPGSWLRCRQNDSLPMSYTDMNGTHMVRLQANSYQTRVKLLKQYYDQLEQVRAEDLANIGRERHKKAPALFQRLLATPRAIQSIRVELIGSEHTVPIERLHIVPALDNRPWRAIGSATTVDFRLDPEETAEMALVRYLTAWIPKPREILERHRELALLRQFRSSQRLLNLLRVYGYRAEDLGPADWTELTQFLAGLGTVATTGSVALNQWAEEHQQVMLQLDNQRRPVALTTTATQQPDAGRHHYCQQLVKYLKDYESKTKLSIAQKSVARPTTGIELPGEIQHLILGQGQGQGPLFGVEEGDRRLYYTPADYNQLTSSRFWQNYQDVLPELATIQAQCGKLADMLAQLSAWYLRHNQGILSLLIRQLRTPGGEPSSLLQYLNSFVLEDPFEADKFVRTIEQFTEKGLLDFNTVGGNYLIRATGEWVCCGHIVAVAKRDDIQAFKGQNGQCKFCGATIDRLEEEDEFNPNIQTTLRELFVFTPEKLTEDPKIYAKYFINATMQELNTILRQNGLSVDPAEMTASFNEALERMAAAGPEFLNPYGSNLPEKPQPVAGEKAIWTSDLRAAIIYYVALEGDTEANKQNGQISTLLVGTKVNSSRNNAVGRAISGYMAGHTNFRPETEWRTRLAGKSETIMKGPDSYRILFNALMMHFLAYDLGLVLAYVNYGIESSTGRRFKLADYIQDETIYTICNRFLFLIHRGLTDHLKDVQANTGGANQTALLNKYTGLLRLFSAGGNGYGHEHAGQFYPEVYNSGLVCPSQPRAALARAMESYNQVVNDLLVKHAGWYNMLEEKAGTQAGLTQWGGAIVINLPAEAAALSGGGPTTTLDSLLAADIGYIWNGRSYGQELEGIYQELDQRLVDTVVLDPNSGTEVRVGDVFMEGRFNTLVASCGPGLELLNAKLSRSESEAPVNSYYTTNQSRLAQVRPAAPGVPPAESTSLTLTPIQTSWEPALQPEPRLVSGRICGSSGSDAWLRLSDKVLELERKTELKDIVLGLLTNAAKLETSALSVALGDRLSSWLQGLLPSNKLAELNNDRNQTRLKKLPEITFYAELAVSPPAELLAEVGLEPTKFPTGIPQPIAYGLILDKLRTGRATNNGKLLIKCLRWLSQEHADLADLEAKIELSADNNLGSFDYLTGQELISTEGYISPGIVQLGLKLAEQPELRTALRLEQYRATFKLLDNLSYHQYLQLTIGSEFASWEAYVKLPGLANLMDLHVQLLRIANELSTNAQVSAKDVSRITERITPQMLSHGAGAAFLDLLHKAIEALTAFPQDPDPSVIDLLYQKRSQQRIIRTTLSSGKKSGFGHLEEQLDLVAVEAAHLEDMTQHEAQLEDAIAGGVTDEAQDMAAIVNDPADADMEAFDPEAMLNVIQGEAEEELAVGDNAYTPYNEGD